MNEIQISFRSGDLTLEGLLANPGANAPAAVVCHPHPLYGGSMYNNVVDAILAAMWQAGYATLRFNFRGVGASEGEHDGGPGEVDDAVAAMTYLLAQPGVLTARGPNEQESLDIAYGREVARGLAAFGSSLGIIGRSCPIAASVCWSSIRRLMALSTITGSCVRRRIGLKRCWWWPRIRSA